MDMYIFPIETEFKKAGENPWEVFFIVFLVLKNIHLHTVCWT